MSEFIVLILFCNLFPNINQLDALNFIISLFQALNKLIIKFSASSWLILGNKYIEMHGQQNIKICFVNFDFFLPN